MARLNTPKPYSGKLTKSMEKYRPRIKKIWNEYEEGWWIEYMPGWCSETLGCTERGHDVCYCVHYEHEYKRSDLWDAVRCCEPCDCEECRRYK